MLLQLYPSTGECHSTLQLLRKIAHFKQLSVSLVYGQTMEPTLGRLIQKERCQPDHYTLVNGQTQPSSKHAKQWHKRAADQLAHPLNMVYRGSPLQKKWYVSTNYKKLRGTTIWRSLLEATGRFLVVATFLCYCVAILACYTRTPKLLLAGSGHPYYEGSFASANYEISACGTGH